MALAFVDSRKPDHCTTAKKAGTRGGFVASMAMLNHNSLENSMKFRLATLVLMAAPALALAQQGPTDPQIAAIVVTANQVDIDAGKLAEKTTKNKDVKAFAKQMVTDHSSVNKQAGDLVKKLGVKPESNATSEALKKGGDENEANLKKLKGKEFDKAYVDHEVAYHEQVLDAIDKTLIPSAKNAELKGLIEKVRPAFVAHLEHAKHLQSMLK
jgi:putative membrane protein